MSEIETIEGSPMQQFYRDKSIFLTGATGFMGKVVAEKLLRVCPDVRTIYMLIRPKKGKDIAKRFEEIFSDPVFAILHEQQPKFMARVVPIAGDVSQKGLGLREEDRRTLCDNVQIVIHAAATVRFDEKLRLATAINVQGTKDLLCLARAMTSLQAIVHVSTAYSNCHLREIKEQFYQPPVSHDALMKCVESLDDRLLDAATPALLDRWPNTYAYTKAVAEDAVRELGKDLPIVLFRPSIVLATWREPVSGWIDNVYGPTGVVVGAGLGVLRTLHADKDAVADLVPVDMAVSALLSAAYHAATVKREEHEEVPIFNYVSSSQKPITWGEFMELNYKHGVNIPSVRAIWYYTLTLHRSRFVHLIFAFFLHLLPALIVDAALVVVGRRPQMLKVYQKIARFSEVISYFSTQQWTFTDTNTRALWKELDASDQKLFNFDMAAMDWENYFETHIFGLRRYLAKDDPSTLPAARRRWFRFYVIHRLLQCVFAYLAIRLLWAVFSAVLF